MLLVADIGNTNAVFGLFGPEAESPFATWRLNTQRDRMPDEWYAALAPLFAAAGHTPTDVAAVVLASVVPSITRWLGAMCRDRLGVEPIVLSAELDLGMRALIDNPREVGADRLANCVAAFARYGGPAIVVDFGTAINFDVVSAHGDFLGGAIAPGPSIALEALAGRAARLFSVEIALPAKAIGTNTVTNIQSGLVLGTLAMLEGLITRMRTELGVEAPVIVTGGYAEVFASATPLITHHDPDLTIAGLRLIHGRLAARSGR
ncbi:MAG: Pantothenate kinase type III, CoaX-like [uncultured Thermomicrobiales bacterium]|uniref:Type III pantothenate kinase n=1 Tax=uncultured Thermomicrobiales bacterium TaxID=1645740 RepID=A0A6J4TUJ1_9BACT|nr:MAG: Pantothenate kinase type III, CoaX-like [uncultured Thermomicrobiales bacterium]